MKLVIAFLFMYLAATTGFAAESKATGTVYLYQPNTELLRRWPCTDQAARYIADVVNLFEFVALNAKQQSPASGAMVIAIAPGRKLKVWTVNYQGEIDPVISGAFEQLLNDGEIPDVVDGPVVFGYLISLAGAPFVNKGLPFPDEWRELLARSGDSPMETGALVSKFFPNVETATVASPCQAKR